MSRGASTATSELETPTAVATSSWRPVELERLAAMPLEAASLARCSSTLTARAVTTEEVTSLTSTTVPTSSSTSIRLAREPRTYRRSIERTTALARRRRLGSGLHDSSVWLSFTDESSRRVALRAETLHVPATQPPQSCSHTLSTSAAKLELLESSVDRATSTDSMMVACTLTSSTSSLGNVLRIVAMTAVLNESAVTFALGPVNEKSMWTAKASGEAGGRRGGDDGGRGGTIGGGGE